MSKKIIIACPHGFCAGVGRAIDIIEEVIKRYPPPIYCLNEIVHNKQVVKILADEGIIFVHDIEKVPRGATLLFSAHGIPPSIMNQAKKLKLNIVDATCPFVTKVHQEVKAYSAKGYKIILIGFRKHDEVIGVVGEAPENVIVVENPSEAEMLRLDKSEKIMALSQTTLSLDDVNKVMDVLHRKFTDLTVPLHTDICYATTNRQNAVKSLAEKVKHILVLGSKNSSNTNRLAEVAISKGAHAYLVESLIDLKGVPVNEVETIGLTAGASTPETFVDEVIAELNALGFTKKEELKTAEEKLKFPLPPELLKRKQN